MGNVLLGFCKPFKQSFAGWRPIHPLKNAARLVLGPLFAAGPPLLAPATAMRRTTTIGPRPSVGADYRRRRWRTVRFTQMR
jgi:hypothetical protein